jgi:hypothetical protein
MGEWTGKEKGPDCFCGCPTWVEPVGSGPPILICIFHSKEAGASFPLPADRPDNWPNLTPEELHAYLLRGTDEAKARGETFDDS